MTQNGANFEVFTNARKDYMEFILSSFEGYWDKPRDMEAEEAVARDISALFSLDHPDPNPDLEHNQTIRRAGRPDGCVVIGRENNEEYEFLETVHGKDKGKIGVYCWARADEGVSWCADSIEVVPRQSLF